MYNALNRQLDELVKKIDSRHFNDPDITTWLHEMAALAIENEQETVNFFNNCNADHARIIYWLSPFFEDIANEFSSDEIINSMKLLPQKYPEDVGLSDDVEVAIEIMYRIRETSGDLE